MSTTKDAYEAPNISQQFTRMKSSSTKLEWRIENFQKAIRFYQRDQSFSSKTFIVPHLRVVWQLDVYPSGRGGNVHPWFYLRLIGFQTPEGSLSADKAKSIMADYKIYLLSSTNEERTVKQNLSEFEIDDAEGTYERKETIDKFIHPNGSLMVICEVENFAREETLSIELKPNPDVFDANLQLASHIGEMWKSQLFTDCTLKVGEKSFPAHKCILGQWSEVFRKMFSLPTEEAKSGVVEITDFGPDAISTMLEYMYTGAVKSKVMEELALKLLELSDKYAVFPLREMCEVYIASKLESANLLHLVLFAERFSAFKLKKACVNRLVIDGREALQLEHWEELKSRDKDLANEILELVIKDHHCTPNVQTTKDGKSHFSSASPVGQYISSKTFILPHLQAVWQLNVYPRGMSSGDNGRLNAYPHGMSSGDNGRLVTFKLCLLGFQTPDGSLSADKTKGIVANYKIYVLSSTNEERVFVSGLAEFAIDTGNSKLTTLGLESVEKINQFLHLDGSLLVICEIESLVSKETFDVEPTPSPELLNPYLPLSDHFKVMWKSQEFTDCTLKVGEKSFPTHKCILSHWSEVFHNMFSLPLEESKNGIVEIEDFSADSVNAMLEYMYTGGVQYKVMVNGNLVMELLALADKYAIFPLKDQCEDFMVSRLTTENFLQAAIFGNRFSAAKLKKACANRFAIEGLAALQSKEWDDLKSNDKDLANELLELMIKDQPNQSIPDVAKRSYCHNFKRSVKKVSQPISAFSANGVKCFVKSFIADRGGQERSCGNNGFWSGCGNGLEQYDGREALQLEHWEELKSRDKDLANEILELVIKDHHCTPNVQTTKDGKWSIERRESVKKDSAQRDSVKEKIVKTGQYISSKTFILPHLQAVWQLNVYPRGMSSGDNGRLNAYPHGMSSGDNGRLVTFKLCLLGFQTPDGSLSADKTKGITANYKIYVLSRTNEERVSVSGLAEFAIDMGNSQLTTLGLESVEKINQFLHLDGSLLVICEIESLVSKETFAIEPTPSPELLNPYLQLSDHFKVMWKSQQFTDCTLKVGEKSFPTHKCILSHWSEVFHNMFSLPLEESKNGIVEIEDFSADSVNAMLEYMYTGGVQYKVMVNGNLVMELLALADKYAIFPLKDLCEDFMVSRLTTENFLQAAIFGNRFSAAKLKKACANRFAIEGLAALQSKEWDDLKSNDKDLANELLELMIKDQPSFGDVPKATKQYNENYVILH
ncbi:BTB/POZ domain-containing protein [Ditylenchus destructor]|nr:BTB/POZ domain-containing protein [Ditylenchus destructor]